jgi:hypothetical protein
MADNTGKQKEKFSSGVYNPKAVLEDIDGMGVLSQSAINNMYLDSINQNNTINNSNAINNGAMDLLGRYTIGGTSNINTLGGGTIASDLVPRALRPDNTIENLSTTNLENDLLNDGVDMLDPNVTGLGGDKSIVTDDEAWDAVDKNKNLASIFQDALDIFGAYDRNSIRKVVDVVNERGVSAQEVARITGNTVESINQAAAESDTAIENQGTADTGVADTGDVFNEATDTLNTGEVLTPSAPEEVANNDTPVLNNETPVLTDETPVIPVLDTPVIPEDPDVIVTDTPILPTIMQPTPKQTTNISLFQSIQDTPITDSLFFEPKFTELDNIPVGMFERFMQATGGR